MILSMLDRYVILSVDRVRIEKLLKNAYLTNRRLARDLEKELEIINASINFLFQKIVEKISKSSTEELIGLSKCLERKSLKVKSEMSETDTVLKMSENNKEVAESTKDEIAIKKYESIIEDTKDKRKEQQEELNCYDGTLSLCYKMHFESKVTNR